MFAGAPHVAVTCGCLEFNSLTPRVPPRPFLQVLTFAFVGALLVRFLHPDSLYRGCARHFFAPKGADFSPMFEIGARPLERVQAVAAFSRDKKESARTTHLAAAGGCRGIAAATGLSSSLFDLISAGAALSAAWKVRSLSLLYCRGSCLPRPAFSARCAFQFSFFCTVSRGCATRRHL